MDNVPDKGIEGVIESIETLRIQSLKNPASIRVVHNDGQKCQSIMTRMYGSLNDGATRFSGTYICPKDGAAVTITVIAPPDVPYELFNGKKFEGPK